MALGRELGPVVPPVGVGGGRRLLPSADALDYVHKLTQTSLLVGAVFLFVLLAAGNPGRALRGLVNKHVAEVK